MISAEGLTVCRGDRTVLRDVTVSARDGEVLGIVGPNGSGKSSLLMCLHGSLPIQEGAVCVDGQDVSALSRRQIAARIAVVAQERDAVLPLTVRDSIGLGRLASRSLIGYGDDADQILIDAAMARLELTELADRLVTELSGGERQRVLIARAVAQQADHLLLDEPTNHLDLRHQFALLDLIAELGRTTVIVLHDLNLAARCCERVVLLDGGRVVTSGPSAQVLRPEIVAEVYRLRLSTREWRKRTHLLFDTP